MTVGVQRLGASAVREDLRLTSHRPGGWLGRVVETDVGHRPQPDALSPREKTRCSCARCTTCPDSRSRRSLARSSGSPCGRHIGSRLGANLKFIVGGELRGTTKDLVDSRHEAQQRLVEEAAAPGADAILAMRFDASEIGGGGRRSAPTGQRFGWVSV